MKNYEFDVKIMGNAHLIVPDTSYESAKQKVENLIKDLTIDRIEKKQSPVKDVVIQKSNVLKKIVRKRTLESER